MKQLFLIVLSFIVGSCMSKPGANESLRLLVFTKTNDYRHEVIPVSIDALRGICNNNGWLMTATQDSLMFSSATLDDVEVVVFMHTTGDVLGDSQRDALKNFVERGGGLVTIHSGTATENSWSWYVNAVGAIFTGHPPVQSGKLIIEDKTHPATSFLPDSVWILEDEWYSFDRNPRNNVHVLISIDETSYDVDDNRWFPDAKQRMGDHPLVWCQEVKRGRVFQTALGHEPALYADTLFLKHLEGAVKWAAKLVE